MKFAAWAAMGCLILAAGLGSAEVPLLPSAEKAAWRGPHPGGEVEDNRVEATSARLAAVARQFCASRRSNRHGAACTNGVAAYDSPMPYASTNGYGVRIWTGFVRLAASDSELAFVPLRASAIRLSQITLSRDYRL